MSRICKVDIGYVLKLPVRKKIKILNAFREQIRRIPPSFI